MDKKLGWVLMVGWSIAHGAVVGATSSQTLWQKGDNGYDTFRIPAVATATNGVLLAFCEGRKNSISDAGDIDLVLRRSKDGGASWESQQLVWSDGVNTCGNPVPIVDRTTGRIVLLMTWNLGSDGESAIINKTSSDTRRVFVTHSDDHGATWTTPVDMTAAVKAADWGWYATGPGGGIQLMNGSHAGRLVVPCDHSDSSGAFRSHVIYSDDAGSTWQLGGVVPGTQLNECQVAELAGGRMVINMRNYDRTIKARRVAFSDDGGATWSAPVFDTTLIEPICEASLERVCWPQAETAGIVAFLNPASETSRVNLTLRLSTNDTVTWAQSRVLFAGPSAYSDMTVTPAGAILAVFECGVSAAYEEIRASLVTAGTDTVAPLSSGFASTSTIVEDGLQVRFSADKDVNGGSVANGDLVSTWASAEGGTDLSVAASSTSRPVWVQNAFQRADGSWAPAVRFNRNLADTATVDGTPQRMESTVNTTLALTNDSTWFVVMRLATNHQERGVFGLSSAGVATAYAGRFGAFFLTTTPDTYNRLRTHNLNNLNNAQGDVQTNVTLLVDSRRSGGVAPAVGARVNGARLGTDTTSSTFTNAPANFKFRIGDQLLGSPKHFIGDIAEVIVYNRALNDAERVIMQNALSARYGVALTTNDYYTGDEAAAGAYGRDVVGIGSFADTGVSALSGVVSNSGCSAGLRLAQRNGSLGSNREFLFAGHRSVENGWTDVAVDGASCVQRWMRVWRLQKVSSDGIDARLTFDFGTAGGGGYIPEADYRLVYRRNDGELFAALNVSPVESEGTISFDLTDAMLVDGEYSLGIGGAGGVTYPQAGIADGLTVWLRADRAVSGAAGTNGALVSTWGNFGAIGPLADVSAEAESNAPLFKLDGVERATGVFEPVVRFNWDEAQSQPTENNLHRLTTGSGKTDFNIVSDSTWFVAFKTLTPLYNRGLFGSANNSSRFGAFFTSDIPGNRMRIQNNLYTYQTFEYTVPNNALMIMDSRRSGPTNAAFISYRGNGSAGGDFAMVSSNLYLCVKDQFRVGNQHFTTATNNFIGDIAEIRIYNRALNDAERVIIQNHLAARYGNTLSANNLYAGKDAAAGDYDLDVIGIGCMTATGTAAIPGTVTDSGDVAGLSLTALDGTLASNNEFVFAGHRTPTNAWTVSDTDGTTCSNRWSRDWYVNRSSSAAALQSANDGVDVRLTFNLIAVGGGGAPGGGTYRLLFRRTLSGPFAALPITAVVNGSKVSFDVTGDALVNGYYALGTGAGAAAPGGASLCAGVGRSLRAWFRADDGAWAGVAAATNGDPVTRWANLGLSGAGLDVAVTNDAMRPLWVQNAFQRGDGKWAPALRFNRNLAGTGNISGEPNRLTSYPATTDFDVVTDVSWFLVLKPAVSQFQRGVFGAGDDTARFGIFYLGTPNDRMRYHVFSANQNVDVPVGAAMLTEYRRSRLASNYALSARLNGSNVIDTAGSALAPALGEFRIGSIPLVGVPNNFIGDIAELRVYNRAVLDAERTVIQNHLAARYGVALTMNDVYAGKGAAEGDCDLDVVGVGCTTSAASGLCPGSMTSSDSSQGLSFDALNGTLSGNGEYLLAGHGVATNAWIYSGSRATGATYRWRREWYLDKTSSDGLEVRLTFDFGAAGVNWRLESEEASYRLLWRADAASSYADTGLVPAVNGDTLTFELGDGDLVDGLYTVGALLPARGTMVLLH